jgi:protein AbiQ
MNLKKLEDLFYQENSHLVEVLDKDHTNNWTPRKQRGYGIVVCEVDGLRFGIPLRSHLKHKHGQKTVGDKGIDYSKAVLLTKDSYISSQPFLIPDNEHRILQSKEHWITQQFSKYVQRYIKGRTKNDLNILREYRFSTLQNYHTELGV